jgi:tRNA 2-selenouridine synthase
LYKIEEYNLLVKEAKFMLKEITIEEFLKLDKAVSVDVRSPIEFAEGSIPGAINLPLFTDEERAEIGTIYKKIGQEAAKWKAMEIVSPKIPTIMTEIKLLIENGNVPVINCWRGGMRSKSICTFLEYSGLQSIRLTGGYKAYRQYTLNRISELLPEKAIVLHGKTGVGKTEVLHQLKEKGYPILDLEAIAGHRGSIFGAMGIGEGYTQKTFDALLFSRLSEIKDFPYFIIEAESKRIGRVIQPEELLVKKESGYHLYLDASIKRRVEHIVNEYVKPYSTEYWFKEKVQNGLTMIAKRMKSAQIQIEINKSFSEENWYDLIKILLEDYYDPRYDFKRSAYVESVETIDAENIENAVAEIESYLMSMNFPVKQTV